MLQSMGSQRVGYNFATEEQQHLVESLLINDLLIPYINICQLKSKQLEISAPSESRLKGKVNVKIVLSTQKQVKI